MVDPHQVVLYNDLEENLNFHTIDNIFVNVDAEEWNDVLSSSRHSQVDENDEINVKDYDGDEDESINEQEENSD